MKNLINYLIIIYFLICSNYAMSQDFTLIGCIVAGKNSIVVLKTSTETKAFKLHDEIEPSIYINEINYKHMRCTIRLSNNTTLIDNLESRYLKQVKTSEEQLIDGIHKASEVETASENKVLNLEKRLEKVTALKSQGIEVDNPTKDEIQQLLKDIQDQVELDKQNEKRQEQENAE